MNHDVFISFKFENQIIVDKIVNQLTNLYGISCWICTEQIRAGENFREDISEAIKASQLVVLVQSRLSAMSEEVMNEIVQAVNHGKKVMPFIIEESQLGNVLKSLLKDIHYIDATKPTIDERIRDLAKDICLILGKPFSINDKPQQRTTSTSLVSTPVNFDNDDVFIGRETLMDDIHKAFEKHGTVCLQGMGGIGKTELAKQYYDKYKLTQNGGFYRSIVFARYDGNLTSTIADDLVFNIKGVSRLLTEQDGKEIQQTDEEYAEYKMNELKRICDGYTLIIIDNFDTSDDVEKEKLKKLTDKAPFRVLVTTRNIQPEYKTVKVNELDNNALTELFLKYYGNDNGKFKKDDPAFHELFRIVGCHTLTVEIVAKYLKHIDCIDSVSEMVEILKEEGFSVFDEDEQQVEAYKRIKDVLLKSNLSDSETYLLKCLALMPASGIKFNEFFGVWLGGKIRVWNSMINKLESRGFVKYDSGYGTVNLHPIIRETVVEDLKPDYASCKDFLERFKSRLYDYISWNYSAEVKNLYFECCKSIKRVLSDKPTAESFDLYYHMANLSSFLDDFAETKVRYDKLRVEAIRLFGENSVQFGQIQFRSAFFHSTNGYVDDALDMYLNAITLLSESQTDVIGEYVLACTEISKLYALKGDTEAEKHYLDISLDLINDGSLLDKFEIMRYRKFMVENTVCRKLMREGKYSSALELAERVLNYCKTLPHTLNDVTSILFTIGNICMNIDDYDKAIKSFIESISLGDEYGVYTSLHFNKRLMRTWFVLAECYEAKGSDFTELRNDSVVKGLEIANDIYSKDSSEYLEIIQKYEY